MNLTGSDYAKLKNAKDLKAFTSILQDLEIPVTTSQVEELYDIRENSVQDIITALNSDILANSVAGGIVPAEAANKIYIDDELSAVISGIEADKVSAQVKLKDLLYPLNSNTEIADLLVSYVGDLDMPGKASGFVYK